MKKILLILLLTTSLNLFGQNNLKEILLIGTFHFNNPGADIAQVKNFDVLSDQSQKDLELMSNQIKKYNPDKIFVEWEYDKQAKLDSLYNLFTKNEYFDYIQNKYPKNNFYKQNEIFQLAFRAASKSNLKKVYAIDYRKAFFPFDSLMNSIEKAKQFDLKKSIENKIKEFETISNLARQKLTLAENILQVNTEEYRKLDLGAYITLFNQGGATDNFVGSYLVSEWYRRNLFMYSLLQKLTESKDKKVMVLLGASHIAIFKKFIELDDNFKVVELKDVMKK